MKYWDFNVVNLISDFEKNTRTLAGITEGLDYTRKLLKTDLNEKTDGEVEAYIKMLEMREAEYRWYTDLVILGLRELPEIERNVLRWWLIEHMRDDEIMYRAGIKNGIELAKIKNISLTEFHNVVMP